MSLFQIILLVLFVLIIETSSNENPSDEVNHVSEQKKNPQKMKIFMFLKDFSTAIQFTSE